MSLFHHDSRSYHEAATDAAKQARKKMEALIEQGRKNAMAAIDRVIEEVPQDRIVAGPALKFGLDNERNLVVDIKGEARERIHRNAAGQLAERGPVELPMKLANQLLDLREGPEPKQGRPDTRGPSLWARELLAHNFEEIYRHSEEKFLTRSFDGQLRGFLSNKFRRLDSRPIIDAAMTAFGKLGAVPINAYTTDVRHTFKAVLPRIFEPVPNEVLLIGVEWANSDYGNGAHSLKAIVLRLWCTNYAITEQCLRQVHVGSRLDEDDVFSDNTYRLDTERSASMVSDVIKGALAPAGVNKVLAAVYDANEEKIDPKQVDAYLKKHLSAGTAREVAKAFASADVENLPPGQTKWRMSNAISWIAGKENDAEKKLELMEIAGKVLDVQAVSVKAAA